MLLRLSITPLYFFNLIHDLYSKIDKMWGWMYVWLLNTYVFLHLKKVPCPQWHSYLKMLAWEDVFFRGFHVNTKCMFCDLFAVITHLGLNSQKWCLLDPTCVILAHLHGILSKQNSFLVIHTCFLVVLHMCIKPLLLNQAVKKWI